ncbi:MAG: hypothetical protein WAK40_02715 [Thermoplasmata archaeon]
MHLLPPIDAFLCVGVGEILPSNRFVLEPRLVPVRGPARALAVFGLRVALIDFLGPARSGGLLQRIFLGLALCWMLLVAAHLLYGGGHVMDEPAPVAPAASIRR